MVYVFCQPVVKQTTVILHQRDAARAHGAKHRNKIGDSTQHPVVIENFELGGHVFSRVE